MMHVRGRAASKDDLELARRSALAQEKVSFGIQHEPPTGGYGRKAATAQKRPATAQTRRPTRPSSGRARPQSAQVQRTRPVSASRTVRPQSGRPRSGASSARAPSADQLLHARADAAEMAEAVHGARRGRISPDLIDDDENDENVPPGRIYDSQRARSYLPPAVNPGPDQLAKPAPRPISAYREKVPRVGTAVPLKMPEVDAQALPGSARGSQPGSARGEQGSSSQTGYPDLLLLESWMSEMAERVLINKQQEVFSKVMFDRSLLSYTMDAKHGETEVHNMWHAKEHGLSSLGCTREQLYSRHLSSEEVEKLYRALYIYSVGLPTAVKQITEQAAKKEPSSNQDDGREGLPVLALSSFLHLFMEVLKSTHGDSIATQVEDNFVAGVHAKVQAYIAALDALKAEHSLLQQRIGVIQADLDENGGTANKQKIKKLTEAMYDLQTRMKQMMKSQATAMAALEEELLDAEREAMQTKKREAETSRLGDEERAHAVERERVLQAEIDTLQGGMDKVQEEAQAQMATMVDAISKLRNETWVASGGRPLPKVNTGTGDELVQDQIAAIASIAEAVVRERDDVAFKKERGEKARHTKEQQRDRDLAEQWKAADEELQDMERAMRREVDAKERTAEQLNRMGLVFARETATVRDTRRLGKRLLVHLLAKFLHLKTKLKVTTRTLNIAKKTAEIASEEKEAALANQENDRDRKKSELGESLAGQQHQLLAMLAEVKTLKGELLDSKETLASKQELKDQIEKGHEKIRELLGEVERLNSVHSGEMATREMHIGRIEVQLQATHNGQDQAIAELRQARAEHVAYVAQATVRRDKLQADLDKNKTKMEELLHYQVEAEKTMGSNIVKIGGLEEKLSNEQTLDRALQGKLTAEVERLETALKKSQFYAQRQEQMRGDDVVKAKKEVAMLQVKLDGNEVSLSQVKNGLSQQKRLFNAMRYERDLVQNTCLNIEQSLVAERRNVVDAARKQSEAEKHFQGSRTTIRDLEDERDVALGRLADIDGERVQLQAEIEAARAAEVRQLKEAKLRRQAALSANVHSTQEAGTQSDGLGHFEMESVLEELRIAEVRRDMALKRRDQATTGEKVAYNTAERLRGEVELLMAGREPTAAMKQDAMTVAQVLKDALLEHYEEKIRALGCAVPAELEKLTDADKEGMGMTEIEWQRLLSALHPLDANASAVAMEPSKLDLLPLNLSSLMHDAPPEFVRYVSLKAVLSLVRQLYAHCSRTLQECVGPSMQSIGKCIYQFFELKYGRATVDRPGHRGVQTYAHEQHIYEFISSVLRHEHEAPALKLFARFAGVVEDSYSVEAFRFFLYTMSCINTASLMGQGARPRVFTDTGASVKSTGLDVPTKVWLTEDYAMEIFKRVMGDTRLEKIMEFELKSVLSHRPSRQNASSTPCIEQDLFLLKVCELWNEAKPVEEGGSRVRAREDMFLRSEDAMGAYGDAATMFLERWNTLGQRSFGARDEKAEAKATIYSSLPRGGVHV